MQAGISWAPRAPGRAWFARRAVRCRRGHSARLQRPPVQPARSCTSSGWRLCAGRRRERPDVSPGAGAESAGYRPGGEGHEQAHALPATAWNHHPRDRARRRRSDRGCRRDHGRERSVAGPSTGPPAMGATDSLPKVCAIWALRQSCFRSWARCTPTPLWITCTNDIPNGLSIHDNIKHLPIRNAGIPQVGFLCSATERRVTEPSR